VFVVFVIYLTIWFCSHPLYNMQAMRGRMSTVRRVMSYLSSPKTPNKDII
jgi:hypothetical protein